MLNEFVQDRLEWIDCDQTDWIGLEWNRLEWIDTVTNRPRFVSDNLMDWLDHLDTDRQWMKWMTWMTWMNGLGWIINRLTRLPIDSLPFAFEYRLGGFRAEPDAAPPRVAEGRRPVDAVHDRRSDKTLQLRRLERCHFQSRHGAGNANANATLALSINPHSITSHFTMKHLLKHSVFSSLSAIILSISLRIIHSLY